MFVRLSNEPRGYAWGSSTAIAELLGNVPGGGPEAELWLGAHPRSPARLVDPTEAGGAVDLREWIARDPSTALGGNALNPRLPFLLKILAAASPLSLQVHPNAEQAREGFQREEKAGIPIDAPARNYRDSFPKPEMIYAVSPTFEALCGFRSLGESMSIVQELTAVADDPGQLREFSAALDLGLSHTLGWLAGGGEGVPELVATVTRLASTAAGFKREFATVRDLAMRYPADPGVVISLLLNRVTLVAGEALYLPAGNIHAYLCGVGIELMTASDNVIRGGLTSKHVDVPELLAVVDVRTEGVPYLSPRKEEGLRVFSPEGAGFQLVRVGLDRERAYSWPVDGPTILLCTAGEWLVRGASSEVRLTKGESAYVTPDEQSLRMLGSGELFLAAAAGPEDV
jgi:mannose-6-phosphate isomerase